MRRLILLFPAPAKHVGCAPPTAAYSCEALFVTPERPLFVTPSAAEGPIQIDFSAPPCPSMPLGANGFGRNDDVCVLARSFSSRTGGCFLVTLSVLYLSPRAQSRGLFTLLRSSTRCLSVVPALAQVLPVGVHRIDQGDLLLTPPFLDLFFSLYCRNGVAYHFEVKQPVNLVFVREAGYQVTLMLMDSFSDIACYPNIKSARFARHDVHVVVLHAAIVAGPSIGV
jgi:hypothetical protein